MFDHSGTEKKIFRNNGIGSGRKSNEHHFLKTERSKFF